jgi:hypothetical protein
LEVAQKYNQLLSNKFHKKEQRYFSREFRDQISKIISMGTILLAIDLTKKILLS